MKPVDQSAFKSRAQFRPNSRKPVEVEELFLPSVIGIVEHLARVAAESDYKQFLASGNIPHAQPEQETGDD